MQDLEILTQQFCDYSINFKGYRPATIEGYRQKIGFYKRFMGITTLDEVTNENLRQFFLCGRTERGWGPNTYISYHKCLVVFLRWCREQGYRSDDPLAGIEVPKLRKKLPSKLNKQEALKLLEVVQNLPYPHEFLRHRNYAIFQTFMLAGLRKSELLNLKMVDVDIENLTIFVRQGKGGKDRIIPMSYALAQCLKRYVAERTKLKKMTPYFFTSINRDNGYTDSGLKREVRKLKTTSGIDFHIHKLRHTFATLMLEGGCDIYSLSRMMGHSDIKTTTIYLSASAEHLRAQVTKHPLN